MGLGHDISREFIAVPDGAKQQLLFKWPDRQIRRFTSAIVDVDELAIFISQGRVIGVLQPGRHRIDATELPFLGDVVDKLSGGNAYDSELFFVSTHEFPDLTFGGPVDAVRDPGDPAHRAAAGLRRLRPSGRRPCGAHHEADRHRRSCRPGRRHRLGSRAGAQGGPHRRGRARRQRRVAGARPGRPHSRHRGRHGVLQRTRRSPATESA